MLTRRGLLPSLPGEDHVEVYHSAFTPLEWQLNPERPRNACYVKVRLARRPGIRLRRTCSYSAEVSNGICRMTAWSAAITYEPSTLLGALSAQESLRIFAVSGSLVDVRP